MRASLRRPDSFNSAYLQRLGKSVFCIKKKCLPTQGQPKPRSCRGSQALVLKALHLIHAYAMQAPLMNGVNFRTSPVLIIKFYSYRGLPPTFSQEKTRQVCLFEKYITDTNLNWPINRYKPFRPVQQREFLSFVEEKTQTYVLKYPYKDFYAPLPNWLKVRLRKYNKITTKSGQVINPLTYQITDY